ncbi:serine/threonine-protein kinase [Streptacidiphilus sp. P02-A3a]|uniref:serine/threonine-protein kinase n=1 Tax=Streptacidiphilus sp. P02-A3a TaxID=2704468 RepID=UPI0015F936E4|nr:serine/threonine-protein kinase [Streptacidiphilus sp. P02-A3a]QMU67887.1 protein kinase [Streptacidiphilus sp. P02-A3a]
MRPVGSKYLLEEPLGRGATGTVWRARVRNETGQPGEQTVAIKVLKEELATDPDIVMRFLRERSALLRLVHPNIVRVRDLVVEGEVLALVMDLVDGPDLHRYLADQGPLSPVAGALLMAQVADALAASHVDGIVHRDLKPANVLLATRAQADGAEQMHPLLTDFGIARLADSPGITRTHEFVGTPAYVAPESAEGREQTAAVDVYGAGIMLYELVTGRPPFHGDGPLQILQAHLSQEPERPRNLPEPLWTVIARCLEKDPARRPTAVTLATALRTVAAGVGVHASPAAIDAAFAVGELLTPAVDPRGATLPDGRRYDPAATTLLAGSVAAPTQSVPTAQADRFGAADPTQLLPPGSADPTQLHPRTPQPTTLQPTAVRPTAPQPGQQQWPDQWSQPQEGQQPEGQQPEGPHPWESQLRAARNRNEQTQLGYQEPVEQPQPRARPQVAPPPYRPGPRDYQQPYQPDGYRPDPYQQDSYQQDSYQQDQYSQDQQYQREQHRPGQYAQDQYRPDPHQPRSYQPEPEPERPAPRPAPRAAPPREEPREPEPEPRPRREPRPPRRRMRIPGGGCLRSLLILAVILAVIWYFTPVQHWIHNVEGWWHQVAHWWDSITGTANKIKNDVPKVSSTSLLPSSLPTLGN